jgi:peptide/nickel transport system substrate-binding protein
MTTDDRLQRLTRVLSAPISRRSLLARSAALGVAIPTVSALLAACGDDDDDAAEPAAPAPDDEDDEEEDAVEEPTADDAEEDDAEEDDAEPAPDGEERVLVLRNRGEIVTLDVHHSGGNPDEVMYHNIYSRPVFPMPGEDELVPDMATDWEVSDDGSEYTYHLREGVEWHKGYGEVTAHDFKWTYDRVRDPELASRYAGEYAGISEVHADDDYTLRIALSDPDPMFNLTVVGRTGYVMNEEALEEKGDEYSSDPVGSGPYVMIRWSRGEELECERNEGHWLFQPENNINRAIFKFLLDDTVVELALRSGDLDLAYLETPETQLAALNNPDLVVDNRPAPRTFFLNFGPLEEGRPHADVLIRRAMSLAIDRELIAEEAMDGMGFPAHSIFNTHMYAHVEDGFYPYFYDPDEARALVEEAGYDGTVIELLSPNDTLTMDIATIIQAFWQDVGLNAEVSTLERAIYFDRRNARDFEIACGPIAREFPEHIVYPYLTSAGVPTPNSSGYDGVDEIVNELRPELDMDRRRELMIEIQEQVAEDVATIPIVEPSLVLAHQPFVHRHYTPSIWFLPVWRMSMD